MVAPKAQARSQPTRDISAQRLQHLGGQKATRTIAGVHDYVESLERMLRVCWVVNTLANYVAQLPCIYWHEVHLQKPWQLSCFAHLASPILKVLQSQMRICASLISAWS